MMNTTNSLTLKCFSPLELIHLLYDCALKLGSAHQVLDEQSLHETSIEALKAYDFLLFQLQQEQSAFTLH